MCIAQSAHVRQVLTTMKQPGLSDEIAVTAVSRDWEREKRYPARALASAAEERTQRNEKV